jgi:hypothetical protein
VLLLPDPVDSFWVTSAPSFEGKPFKSVTQGAADLAQIPRLDAKNEPQSETDAAMATFLAFAKTTLGDAVADVRISDRPTDSAVAAEHGPDRQLERLLAGAGRIASTAKHLEVNPRHQLIVALAGLSPDVKGRIWFWRQPVTKAVRFKVGLFFKKRPTECCEMFETRPRRIASSAISRWLQWLIGRSLSDGFSQVIAITAQTCSGVYVAGAPERGASASRSDTD